MKLYAIFMILKDLRKFLREMNEVEAGIRDFFAVLLNFYYNFLCKNSFIVEKILMSMRRVYWK